MPPARGGGGAGAAGPGRGWGGAGERGAAAGGRAARGGDAVAALARRRRGGHGPRERRGQAGRAGRGGGPNPQRVRDRRQLHIAVSGLPEGWWTVAPATAYLVPYGSSGTYEQEIQIHLHPARMPQAEARPWEIEVVARSRAYETQVAGAPATVQIEPYQDVAAKLTPDRASGRLKARFTLTVRNRANAPAEVALSAEDTDSELEFRFAQPTVTVQAGRGVEAPFTVFPPKQIWLGSQRTGRSGSRPRRSGRTSRRRRCPGPTGRSRGFRGGLRSSRRSPPRSSRRSSCWRPSRRWCRT